MCGTYRKWRIDQVSSYNTCHIHIQPNIQKKDETCKLEYKTCRNMIHLSGCPAKGVHMKIFIT